MLISRGLGWRLNNNKVMCAGIRRQHQHQHQHRLTKVLPPIVRQTRVCWLVIVICAGGISSCETRQQITGSCACACACACARLAAYRTSETKNSMILSRHSDPLLSPAWLVSSQILSLHQHPPPDSTHIHTTHRPAARRISFTPSSISPATSKRRRIHPPLRDPPPPHSANCLQRRYNTTHHPSRTYSVLRGRPPPTHALKEAVHSPEFMYSSHAHAFALDPPPEQPQPFRITRTSRHPTHNSTNG